MEGVEPSFATSPAVPEQPEHAQNKRTQSDIQAVLPLGKRVRMRNSLVAAVLAETKKQPEAAPAPIQPPTNSTPVETEISPLEKGLSNQQRTQLRLLDKLLAEVKPLLPASDTKPAARINPVPNAIYHGYEVADIGFVPPKRSEVAPAPVAAPTTPARNPRQKAQTPEHHETKLTGPMAKMMTILRSLMNSPVAFPFLAPVDPVALKIPDYLDVIKHPMDLGTIKANLSAGYYESTEDVAEDIRLVWNNARTYNPPGTDVHIMANKLSDQFEEQFRRLKSGATEASVDARLPVRSVAELKDAIKYVQAEILQLKRDKKTREKLIVGTSFKPKPATNKPAVEAREMTWAEKAALTSAINELDYEHLASVVNIIQDRNPQLAENAQNDLVEIDLEAVDNGTLRALERFVNNLNRKKNKQHKPSQRGGGGEPRGVHQQIQKLERQLHEMGHTNDEEEIDVEAVAPEPATKKEEELEVDIGDHVPNEYPSVVIEKDKTEPSSSSSSSSSTSTSSDSSEDEDALPAAAAPLPAVPPPIVPLIEDKPSEDVKPVVANASAWAPKPESKDQAAAAPSDPLWSEFKNKDQQNRQREKEREEQEEQARLAKLQQEEERKQKEEQLRVEKLEAEQKQKQVALDTESENQKKLAEKREAARRAREQTQKEVDLNSQRLDMSNFEKQFN